MLYIIVCGSETHWDTAGASLSVLLPFSLFYARCLLDASIQYVLGVCEWVRVASFLSLHVNEESVKGVWYKWDMSI